MAESEEPPPAAEIRIGPTSVPYTVIGLGAVLVGAIVVMGGLAILGSMMTNPPHTDCVLEGSDSIGWVELDVGRMSKLGHTHTLSRESDVLADHRDPKSKVCTLPRGTKITLSERDRGRDGTWVAVHGNAVTLPR